MKPYCIQVAYDGTNYHGWQEQKDDRTIAGTMQKKFKYVFGHEIKVVGASRTDAGVHALGQWARFYTDRDIPCNVLMRSWNGALPKDIAIRKLVACPSGFHPQHNVRQKIYQYHFALRRPLPFLARFVAFHSFDLDLDLFERVLSLFKGEHDFAAFCTGVCEKGTTCTVDECSISYLGPYNVYRVTVTGKRFLHHMVRRMIGAALYVASHPDSSAIWVEQALHDGVLHHFLPTAPACGLLLRKILYER